MKFRAKLFPLLGITILGILFLLGTTGVVQAEKIKIKIGCIAQLTGAYGESAIGTVEGHMDAMEAANKYMDLKGAVLEGVWLDGGSDVAKSMAAFKQMTGGSQPVVAITGGSTPVALALKKWYIKKKVPNIDGGSADALFQLPSWTFSVPPPTVNQFGIWVDYYLKHIWPKKGLKRAPRFAWLTWDNALGRAVITEKTEAYLKSKGVDFVGAEFIPFVPTDVSAQMMRLKQKKVDFTFGAMRDNVLAACLKEADNIGIIDQMHNAAFWGMLPTVLLKHAGALARNTYITSITTWKDDWATRCPRELEMFQKNKRKVPKLVHQIVFAQGIIAAEAVRMAIEAKGSAKNITGEDVYHGLTKIRNFDAFGARSSVTFTEKKRYGEDSCILINTKDQKVNVMGVFKAEADLTKYSWK